MIKSLNNRKQPNDQPSLGDLLRKWGQEIDRSSRENKLEIEIIEPENPTNQPTIHPIICCGAEIKDGVCGTCGKILKKENLL